MRIASWAGSRQGSGRGENQDAYGLVPERGLFVLSDGMGGHAEGARASQGVVQEMLSPPDPGDTRAGTRLAQLRQTVLRSHQRVAALAGELGHQGDMGATLVCLWLDGARYQLATVGDSRAYLLRAGRLYQLNEDHTLVHKYLREGTISPEEAENHPQGHVLTQAMGVGRVAPDLFEGDLQEGDRFLLSSDGLHGVLGQDEIKAILEKSQGPDQAGEALLRLVDERRGDDDATVVVVFA